MTLCLSLVCAVEWVRKDKGPLCHQFNDENISNLRIGCAENDYIMRINYAQFSLAMFYKIIPEE